MPKRRSCISVILSQPDGCDIHPHCLTCPLPVCVFHDARVLKRLERER